MASTRTKAASVEELNALSREELVELFLTLEAPELPELVGEFEGHTPEYLRERFAQTSDEDGYGDWLGKSFLLEAHDEWEGHGFNVWQTDSGTSRRIRFGWRRSTSILDERPVVAIEYRAFENGYASLDLADELRRLGDNLLLGIASTKTASPVCPWPGGPGGRSLPTTFLLRGPRGPAQSPDDPAGELRPSQR